MTTDTLVRGATPGELFIAERGRPDGMIVLRRQWYKDGRKSHCTFEATLTEEEARRAMKAEKKGRKRGA